MCDCILRDSQSYLDHINGKWHNRALGMTMRVEKSTVDQVRKKLEEVKERKQQRDDDDYLPEGLDRQVQSHASVFLFITVCRPPAGASWRQSRQRQETKRRSGRRRQ